MIVVRKEEKAFWSAHLLLLFYPYTRTNFRISREFAIIRYLKKAPPVHTMDRVLRCLPWRLVADDGVDHSVSHTVLGLV